jgi:hypothetical protein
MFYSLELDLMASILNNDHFKDGKRPLGISESRWYNNTKMDIRKMVEGYGTGFN